MKPAFILFTLLLLTPLAGLTASPAMAKPNILILYADDMGYGDLGANNPASKIPTPQLDRLAAEGYSGPVCASLKLEADRAILSFTHVGGGLVVRDGELRGFTIAGEDGTFVPAQAAIDGDKVVVSAPSGLKPIAVRYGWDKTPDVNLFNQAGLPATPFRTDPK